VDAACATDIIGSITGIVRGKSPEVGFASQAIKQSYVNQVGALCLIKIFTHLLFAGPQRIIACASVWEGVYAGSRAICDVTGNLICGEFKRSQCLGTGTADIIKQGCQVCASTAIKVECGVLAS